jgi:hypothetical protein
VQLVASEPQPDPGYYIHPSAPVSPVSINQLLFHTHSFVMTDAAETLNFRARHRIIDNKRNEIITDIVMAGFKNTKHVSLALYTVRSESRCALKLRYIYLVVSIDLPLKCAVVSLYSVFEQRLKCSTGKVCNCLIQFLLTTFFF